jgi:hypothetical protein
LKSAQKKSPEKCLDDLQGKQRDALEMLRDQTKVTDTLKEVYFTVHLPAIIKTLKDLDGDLSSGMNACLGEFFGAWHASLLATADRLVGGNAEQVDNDIAAVSCAGLLRAINDPLDVLNQYRDLFAASQAEHNKMASKASSMAVSHRKYSLERERG